MSLTDAEILDIALVNLQNESLNLDGSPNKLRTIELAERLGWSIRRVANAIAERRSEGRLIANLGDGYFLAECHQQMASTLRFYKGRALSALTVLKRMQDATKAEFEDEKQRDFFRETIRESY